MYAAAESLGIPTGWTNCLTRDTRLRRNMLIPQMFGCMSPIMIFAHDHYVAMHVCPVRNQS
jgi:hypothetical protein